MIKISEKVTKETEEENDYFLEYAEQWKELSSRLSGFISGGGGEVANLKEEDLQRYLQNPYGHLKQIRNASKYLTNKHGIVKDVLRMIKTLPTLKYSLNWSVDKSSDIQKHEKAVSQFLDDIGVIRLIRDGLYEVALEGTVILCLRSNRYVQFLEIDDVEIRKQRNGKWIVEFDLKSLDNIRDMQDKLIKIDSLPDEVTLNRYLQYSKNNDEKLRYVEIKKCEVVALDAQRNIPYGLPYSIGAWQALLQKEMIDSVEQSMSERLLTQILLLKAGFMDKDERRPVKRELIASYFNNISNLLQQKESNNRRNMGKVNGSGLVALPHFFDLESLDVDTTMFEKDLYEKITDDIYMGLGISRALVMGEGGNYSSAQVNSEKFFSAIFALVEQFEEVINSFISSLLPKNINCKIKFDKSTVLDKQTEIKNKFDVYMQTSNITPWLESVMNMPIEDIVEQRKYEIENKLDSIFFPAQSAHTTSGTDAGRPKKENDEIDNDNTAKTRDNDGNDNPSPSDQ